MCCFCRAFGTKKHHISFVGRSGNGTDGCTSIQYNRQYAYEYNVCVIKLLGRLKWRTRYFPKKIPVIPTNAVGIITFVTICVSFFDPKGFNKRNMSLKLTLRYSKRHFKDYDSCVYSLMIKINFHSLSVIYHNLLSIVYTTTQNKFGVASNIKINYLLVYFNNNIRIFSRVSKYFYKTKKSTKN